MAEDKESQEIQIGEFNIFKADDCVYIVRDDGEGGGFDESLVRDAIDEFLYKHH